MTLARMAVAFLLLSMPLAHAQTASGITTFEYGVYSGGSTSMQSVSPKGIGYAPPSDYQVLRKTRTVIAGIGVSFGFRYVLNGGIGLGVPVRIVTHFPPPGVVGEAGQQGITEDETSGTEALGSENYFGWTFAHPTDLVPGQWSFEFWSGNKKIGEESFLVVLPGTS